MSSSGSHARVGTVVAGYRLEELIGRGGMSLVFRAEDLALGRRVALKLISPELAESHGFRERFRQESRVAASIDHPNVVPIFEAGEADGELFIAMRYVEGTDLKALIANEGALDPQQAISVISQAASGLDAAHRLGLVHRDVKPSNVLCSRDGDELNVYLADFGLTRSADSEAELSQGAVLSGSTDYVSPEQIADGSATTSSDIYALGCVLYECLTGRVPFPADEELRVMWAHLEEPPPRPSDVDPSLPGDLDSVIAVALAKEPQDRYATGGALAQAARETFEPASSGESRRRVAVGVAVVALVAAAVAIPAVLILGDEASQPAVGAPTLDIAIDSVQRLDPDSGAVVATMPMEFGIGGVVLDRQTGAPLVVEAEDGGYRVHRIDPEANDVTTLTIVAAEPYASTGQAGQTDMGTIASGMESSWINSSDPTNPNFGELSTLTELDGRTGGVRARVSLGVGPSGETPEQRGDFSGFRQSVDHPRFVSDLAVVEGQPGQASDSVLALSPNASALLVVRRSGSGHAVERHSIDGQPPIAMAVDDAGIWVTQLGSVKLLHPTNGEVIRRLDVPFLPTDIEVGGGSVWLVNPVDDSVWRLDALTGELTSTIPVGDGPSNLSLLAGAVWVSNTRDGTVSRIEIAGDVVTDTITVGGRPEAIVANDDGVWVAVHPFASNLEPGAKDAYTAALRRLDDQWTMRFMAILDIRPLFDAGASEWLETHGLAVAAELVEHREELLADLNALVPPPAFAEDHERLLQMHEAALAHERSFAASVQNGDLAGAVLAFGDYCAACPTLRAQMSPEFRELTWLEFFA